MLLVSWELEVSSFETFYMKFTWRFIQKLDSQKNIGMSNIHSKIFETWGKLAMSDINVQSNFLTISDKLHFITSGIR